MQENNRSRKTKSEELGQVEEQMGDMEKNIFK